MKEKKFDIYTNILGVLVIVLGIGLIYGCVSLKKTQNKLRDIESSATATTVTETTTTEETTTTTETQLTTLPLDQLVWQDMQRRVDVLTRLTASFKKDYDQISLKQERGEPLTNDESLRISYYADMVFEKWDLVELLKKHQEEG